MKLFKWNLYIVLVALQIVFFAPLLNAAPDLNIDSTDITFSQQNPDLNTVITISATITNSGDTYTGTVVEQEVPFTTYSRIFNNYWFGVSHRTSEAVNAIGVGLLITDLGADDDLIVNIQTNEVVASTHLPTGIALSTKTINVDGEGASGFVWYDIMFDSAVPLAANTTYWIVAKNYRVDASSNSYGWPSGAASAAPDSNGAYSNDQGVNWILSSFDRSFRIYSATNVAVDFYNGDPDSGGSLIQSKQIAPIPNAGSTIVNSTWAATPAGPDDIYVRIDPDNYLVETSTTDNTANNTIEVDVPKLLSSATIDDDMNGRIDGYRLEFNEAMDDTNWNKNGFDVLAYSTGTFSNPSNHSDDSADDNIIYITFDESGSEDSATVPELTYSSGPADGDLEDFDNSLDLYSIPASSLTETDGAAPILYSAVASDSGGGPGIQAGDQIVLNFSEPISNPPTISNQNIDSVLGSTFSWTWKDGDGNIGGIGVWSGADSILTITLSDANGAPTIDAGYNIVLDSFTFGDAANNFSSHTIVLGGDFGVDTTSPTISARDTFDLDSDGYIDAVKITFSEAVDDSSVIESSFTVAGATGVSFSSTTAGDTADNNVIYITFDDGALLTDASPLLTIPQGAVTDLSGNSPVTSAQNCTDKSAPAILSAVAYDNNLLVPGQDQDDTVVITFSENTTKQQIDNANIDSVFSLSGNHTWSSASGSWDNDGDVLTISFSQAAASDIAVGDTISISSTTVIIEDTSNNISVDTNTITGTFAGTDSLAPKVSSISPSNGAIGVAVNTRITAVFNERMDAAKTTASFSLSAILDNAGTVISKAVPGQFSNEYDTSTLKHTFIFTPAAALSHNHVYKIAFSNQAADTIGNSLKAVSYTFKTLFNKSAENTIASNDNKITVSIPAGSISSDYYIDIITDPAAKSPSAPSLDTANTKLYSDDDPFTFPITDTNIEITAYDSNGTEITSNFQKAVTVTIAYNDIDDDGELDSTTKILPEETLQLHHLDEINDLWVRVPGSIVSQTANTVSGQVSHFSIFALMGSGTTDLSSAYAFPVPFTPSTDSKITFTNLSPICTISIYSLSGELVKEIEHSGGEQEVWEDIEAGSGVYLYTIKNSDDIKKGKLMIIR